MKVAIFLTKHVVVACVCASALIASACADGRGVPTSPSVNAGVAGAVPTAPGDRGAVTQAAVASVSARSGELHVTKECSEYTFLAGSFCTVTSSNVKAIEVGSRIVYAQAAGPASLDSDIVLDLPGPGNNTAFGHCALDFATGVGLCTFSGGTGKFTHFHASANVSYLGGPNWAWDGTYSFSPQD
jgi:hypothetical protein